MRIFAGRLFDPYSLELLGNQVITVSPERGLILEVRSYSNDEPAGVDWSDPLVVDLRHATVLPGFVDAHVHSKFWIA